MEALAGVDSGGANLVCFLDLTCTLSNELLPGSLLFCKSCNNKVILEQVDL